MGYGDLLHSGWWMTYPSERSWTSSVGMIIPFPTEWKVIKFHGSKPPTRYIINHYKSLLTTINHIMLDMDCNLSHNGEPQ